MWIIWVIAGIIVFEILCRININLVDKKLREKENHGEKSDKDLSS